jgi:formyl-CoA transferase
MSSEQRLPLGDIKIVGLTQIITGPLATMTFSDLGAEVVKIEATGRGDISRGINPPPKYFDTLNRNKRSIAIDLMDEQGQEVATELLKDADVFVENIKPGALEKFDLTFEDVSAVNPEIIYCSIKGFGSESPYRDLPAMDMLAQAMGGMMGITGREDGQPVWSGLPVGDIIPSLFAIQSILTALYARQNGTLENEHIEVSMIDCMVYSLSGRAGHTFGTDEPFPRLGTRHPTLAPYGVFQTEDEKIVIGAGTQGIWRPFCDALGRPELKDDERFATIDRRLENRKELTAEIEEELTQRPADEWLDVFHNENISAGKIYDTKTIWNDEHVTQRELYMEMEKSNGEVAQMIDHPNQYRNMGTRHSLAPPALGEQSRELLDGLGFSPGEVDELIESGVVE